MNFNDRTSYIAAAREWKAQYAAHSVQLRQIKHAHKKAQREGKISEANRLYGQIQAGKKRATAMIEERHAAKIEAQRQYLAARSASTQEA